MGQIQVSHLRGDDSVGHVSPSVISSDDSVYINDHASAHLESTEFPVASASLVVAAGFDGDQCC